MTNIEDISTKILNFMTTAQDATSWQIKTALHLQSSAMYIALGALAAQNKVTLQAQGINYKVTLIK